MNKWINNVSFISTLQSKQIAVSMMPLHFDDNHCLIIQDLLGHKQRRQSLSGEKEQYSTKTRAKYSRSQLKPTIIYVIFSIY
jgi:hypothetical protein